MNVYAIYYRLNLFSDFTYFLVDPVTATSSTSGTGGACSAARLLA